MSVREELQKIRSLPGKKRAGYLWDYYRLPALAVLLVLLVVLFFAVSLIRGRRQPVLTGMWIGNIGADTDLDALAASFGERDGVDPRRQRIEFLSGFAIDDAAPETSVVTRSRLAAMLQAGDVDFLVASEEVAALLTGDGLCAPLTSVLSVTDLADLAGHMLTEDGLYGYALDLTGAAFLSGDLPEAHVLVIADGAPHPERIIAFLHYIFE